MGFSGHFALKFPSFILAQAQVLITLLLMSKQNQENLDNWLSNIQLVQGRPESPIQQLTPGLLITVSEREPIYNSGVYVPTMIQNTSCVFLGIPDNLKACPSLYNPCFKDPETKVTEKSKVTS